MTRRQAIKTTAFAMAACATATQAADVAAPSTPIPTTLTATPVAVTQFYTAGPLPYPSDSLEPYFDKQTMVIHHNSHHLLYVFKLNTAIAKHPELGKRPIDKLLTDINSVPEDIRHAVRNFGGGHYNHSLLWTQLAKEAHIVPKGDLFKAIQKSYDSFAHFKELFNESAINLFGSGWVWLTLDEKKELKIEATPNQDCPLLVGRTPLATIDLWEHAYYLKYQNRRSDYVDAFHKVLNWEVIEQRYEKAMA